MKRKTISILFAASFVIGLSTGCENDLKNNNVNDTETHSTGGGVEGTTNGTTSFIGTEPTNSTGSTGKGMENHSTSVTDTSNYNGTEGTTRGSTTH